MGVELNRGETENKAQKKREFGNYKMFEGGSLQEAALPFFIYKGAKGTKSIPQKKRLVQWSRLQAKGEMSASFFSGKGG